MEGDHSEGGDHQWKVITVRGGGRPSVEGDHSEGKGETISGR